ncbi:MAG: TIGR00269 family protein [Candidatus Aenigmarchaeota archaeon]|nr:TIGR00269 family protein [Candidatus Aenigmarchaeota archaeon]
MKQFIYSFENEVNATIKKYKLLKKNEKTLVACSGGKDSITVLYILNKLGYNPEALIIDLHIGKYSDDNLKNLKQVCKEQGIKLHVVSIRKEFGCTPCYAKSLINSKGMNLSSCSICGIMKRYMLNKKARELGANKIATGHNLDDEAQTVLMNFFTCNVDAGLNTGPSTGVIKDKKFVQRVKPLFFSKESDVRKYSEAMNFPVIYDNCPCSTGSFRHEIKDKINQLEKDYPGTKINLVESFLKTVSEIRKNIPKGALKICKKCKEPTRNEKCSVCELFGKIKGFK